MKDERQTKLKNANIRQTKFDRMNERTKNSYLQAIRKWLAAHRNEVNRGCRKAKNAKHTQMNCAMHKSKDGTQHKSKVKQERKKARVCIEERTRERKRKSRLHESLAMFKIIGK